MPFRGITRTVARDVSRNVDMPVYGVSAFSANAAAALANIPAATAAEQTLVAAFVDSCTEWDKIKVCYVFGIATPTGGALRDLKSSEVATPAGSPAPVHSPGDGYFFDNIANSMTLPCNPSTLGLADDEHFSLYFYTTLGVSGSRRIFAADEVAVSETSMTQAGGAAALRTQFGTGSLGNATAPQANSHWLAQRNGALAVDAELWIDGVSPVSTHVGSGVAADATCVLGNNGANSQTNMGISVFTLGNYLTDPAELATAVDTLVVGLQAL